MTAGYIEHHVGGAVPIRSWTHNVPLEPDAIRQLANIARLNIVHHHVAAMPDVHVGIGATVGSVIPTVKAIIPAAVGVDIGCGMMASKTTLRAADLPDSLRQMRTNIERAVPHGRVPKGRDPGSWHDVPDAVDRVWAALADGFDRICEDQPGMRKTNNRNHLGTLGTGNHFIEICLDAVDAVWVMLHSGSRGVGNAIGTRYIELAKKDAELHQRRLPDTNLAYFEEGAKHFDAYVRAVGWAQSFAQHNRELMMQAVLQSLRETVRKPFQANIEAVNCHHNYVQREHHFGADVWLTRKGAVSARQGELGIIPGSMGARSYIVRGKGNPESFHSCAHGAGRQLSRTEARRRFTLEDHAAATAHVECRKDAEVIDETPGAYKDIDAVMAAQADLVEVVHQLRQIVCVKG
jgi:tRNA-splicing ligase RtcB